MKEVRSVFASDLDGDGDQDVLSAGDVLAWYENTDGKGSFSSAEVIARSGGFGSILVADLDTDGHPDVLSALKKGTQVTWYRNFLDQEQGFSTAQPIVSRLAEGNTDT